MKQKKNQETYNRFAFYHQNEALLYQFFLHECLSTFKKLHDHVPSKELLIQLVGPENSHVPCHTAKGHLPKLQHYFTLMLTYFEDPDHAMVKKLEQTLRKAHSTAKNCLHMMQENAKDADHGKTFQQLKKEIKKITSLLFEKIDDYQKNEHVLFFLLSRHAELDLIYGEPIAAKTLEALFPGGLFEAGNFLSEKYSQKGFHHLLPLIDEHISCLSKYV